MARIEFALFDTPVGACGIAWRDAGIVSVRLPEGRESRMRAYLVERFPEATESVPPPRVQRAIDAIVALAQGEPIDLNGVTLDMDGVPPFHRRVYDVARTIPPGATLSYGEIATRLGAKGSARAVGQALGRNPFAIVVPCHRVLAAGGKVGGFSAAGGITTKLRLLAIESAAASPPEAVFEGDGVFGFDVNTAVEHLRGKDAPLARLMDKVGPFRMQLQRTPSLFGALAEAIVYQQLTAKAAGTIFARVCALFPRAHEGPTAKQILRAKTEKLREAGLSGSKVLSLKDLAQKAEEGLIPTLAEVHSMTDAEIIERLTVVRGIGQWSVEMLLIFRLGRPDVLPLDDYGVRKGFAATFKLTELPTKKELERRGERWKPYRTVASWYLWRSLDLDKK